MKSLSLFFTPLTAALGACGAAAAFLSYGQLGSFRALLAALFTFIAALALARLTPLRQRAVLGGALLIGLVLLYIWRVGFANSADALSYPFLDTLGEPYNLDFQKPFLMDPALGGGDALTACLLFLVWLFAAGSISKAFRFLAGLISLFLTFAGLYFAVEPPLLAVLFSAAYWLSLFVPATSTQGKGNLTALASALIAGLLVLIAVPSATYSQPSLFRSLSLAITSVLDGAWFHAGSAYTDLLRGVDSKHRLGTADGLRYTGRNIVRIASEPVTHRLYIRSEIGSVYQDNAWHDLPDSAYSDVTDLFQKNQGQWYDQAAWLMEVAAQNPDLGQRLGGYLAEPQPIVSYKKFFSVPEVYETTSHLFIPYDTSFAAPLFTYDRAPIAKEGKAYESYRWDVPLSAAAAFAAGNQGGDSYFRTYVNMEADYRRFVYDHYTDVPDGILDGLTGGQPIPKAKTNEEKRQWIHAVQQLFQTRYTYDIRPGRTPDGEDFIRYFLNDSRRGYCTSFASAGVMLMRAAGIPARYVVGVTAGADEIANAPRSTEGYPMLDLDDSHAHAWAEIYVDGLGWRPVEFTPGVEGGEDPIPNPPERDGNGNPPESQPPKTPDQGNQEQPQQPKDQRQPDQPQGNQSQHPRELPPQGGQTPQQPLTPASSGFGSFLTALAILALLIGATGYAIHRRLAAVPALFAKAETEGNPGLLFPYLLRLTHWAGLPTPSGSYQSWAARAESDARFRHMSRVTALLTKARYAGAPLPASEAAEAIRLIQEMRTACLTGLGTKDKIVFLIFKGL